MRMFLVFAMEACHFRFFRDKYNGNENNKKALVAQNSKESGRRSKKNLGNLEHRLENI